MAYLTGHYWDKLHMTFDAHVDGLYAAAKLAKLDSAKQWLKAARAYHRDGREDKATWAAVNGATELSVFWNANCLGRVSAEECK